MDEGCWCLQYRCDWRAVSKHPVSGTSWRENRLAFQELKTTIGSYQVLDVIGHGGMATVYKAYQPELDRIVAIKIPLPGLIDDAAFRSCFECEARAVAR